MPTSAISRFLAAALAVLALLLAAPAVASAAVFVVNTTADTTPDPNLCSTGTCTLREAVEQAGPTDSISVPAGTYVLSSIEGELLLAGDTLIGAGARSTIIDANGNYRVMSATTMTGVGSSISGVTIRGGLAGQSGGGIQVSGVVSIVNSHIVGNTASSGGGIHVANNGELTVVGSTLAGNTASSVSSSQGGAISTDAEGQTVTLINTTVSGNVARNTGSVNAAVGGGIYAAVGTMTLSNVTVAGNEASPGGGGGLYVSAGAATTLTNTIVGGNVGGGCAGNVSEITASSHHNLVTDGSCGATGPGTVTGDVAGLVGLANNGGPTDTRALAPNSLAINAGSGCTTTDQRGVARPAAACDIGAFEYVAPVLTVTTNVVNNDGGEDGPAAFTVHVRDAGGNEVGGSPQPGTATGTSYALAPGSFHVAAEGPGLYTIAIGGACAADGTVSVGENQTATCTLTADDKQPRPGREVGALPAGGTVRVRKPGGRWQVLTGAGIMPNGTAIDTRRGRITMIAAANRSGRETKADFYEGLFVVRQDAGARPTTTLTLTQKLTCPKAGNAIAAATRKRRLWGSGSGRFRTKGKHSAATVVGTKWLVEDRCRSTLTRVVRGKVSVRDFVKKKTVIVRKGKRYVAKVRR